MTTIEKARRVMLILEDGIRSATAAGDFKTVAVMATFLNGVTTADLARLWDNIRDAD